MTKLIVALDTPDPKKLVEITNELDDIVDTYKLGYRTMFSPDLCGSAYSRKLAKRKKVFLDMKLHDIPSTVEDAVKEIADSGFEFVSVHSSWKVLEAAKRGAEGTNLKILGVTALTHLTDDDLIDDGYASTLENYVYGRITALLSIGIDGIICSGHELEMVEDINKLIKVVPGIRLPSDKYYDQERVITPEQAAHGGADYIVVGRPIIEAEDRRAAAQRYIDHIEGKTK